MYCTAQIHSAEVHLLQEVDERMSQRSLLSFFKTSSPKFGENMTFLCPISSLLLKTRFNCLKTHSHAPFCDYVSDFLQQPSGCLV